MPTNISRFCIFNVNARDVLNAQVPFLCEGLYINEQSMPSARDKNIEIISPVMPILKTLKGDVENQIAAVSYQVQPQRDFVSPPRTPVDRVNQSDERVCKRAAG